MTKLNKAFLPSLLIKSPSETSELRSHPSEAQRAFHDVYIDSHTHLALSIIASDVKHMVAHSFVTHTHVC